ncbi:MAG: hypothetical protein ACFB12_18265 [Leptolyngbyaceae cyanobacterium]
MSTELQQALIVVLGLITIITIDAFRKTLSSNSSSSSKEFTQVIVQDGAYYIDGNVEEIDKRINVEGNYVGSGSIKYGGSEKRQTLAEAAAEIQDLLQQLEKTNPSVSEAEMVAYVNEEIQPDLKSRLVKALKAGGEAALESSLDSHYINLIRAIIKGWSYSEDIEQSATPSKSDSVSDSEN